MNADSAENKGASGFTPAEVLTLGREQQDNLRQEIRIVLEHSRLEAENKGRITFLAAALVGGAAPFLSVRPDLISLDWLKVASALFIATIATGAIDLVGNRRHRGFMISKSSEQTTAMMAAIAIPPGLAGPDNVATQLDKAFNILGEMEQKQKERKQEGLIVDGVFYGTFLLGLVVLTFAFGMGSSTR